MQFERFINLTAEEKAESLQCGGFTRDGEQFTYWRTSCHGEAWFKADEPVGMTEFPEIHGEADVAELEFAPLDDCLNPAFRRVLTRMNAAADDDERTEIWDAWLLRGES